MLVVTRQMNESVRIGKDILITVVRIQGNRVRLGISAPKDLRVERVSEVALEKQDSQ